MRADGPSSVQWTSVGMPESLSVGSCLRGCDSFFQATLSPTCKAVPLILIYTPRLGSNIVNGNILSRLPSDPGGLQTLAQAPFCLARQAAFQLSPPPPIESPHCL